MTIRAEIPKAGMIYNHALSATCRPLSSVFKTFTTRDMQRVTPAPNAAEDRPGSLHPAAAAKYFGGGVSEHLAGCLGKATTKLARARRPLMRSTSSNERLPNGTQSHPIREVLQRWNAPGRIIDIINVMAENENDSVSRPGQSANRLWSVLCSHSVTICFLSRRRCT